MVRVLSLGAGIQSTALYLMAVEGLIEPIDVAIFSDTGEEPLSVYNHLQWLKTFPIPILTTGNGKLGQDLMEGENSTGGRFASIPAFTHAHHDKRSGLSGCRKGMMQRQCTREYKIEPIEKAIRREVFGLQPRQHLPAGSELYQLIGFSWDERQRAERASHRNRSKARCTYELRFPLIEMKWTREDCKEWLRERVPHPVAKSACVFCPYKSPDEWWETYQVKEDWERAVAVDDALRAEGSVVNRNMQQSLYVHYSCLPLSQVDVEKERKDSAARNRLPLLELMCDDGMCGR